MKTLLSSLAIALALSVNAYAYQIADSRYDGEYNGVNLNTAQTAFNSVYAKESGGVDLGMVVVWNTAENPLNWEKWMECNGATTPEEQAKLLNSDMCKSYGICTVPDYRGMFLRGHGSQNHLQYNGSRNGNTWTTHASGALGQIQGDAARRLTGSFTFGNGLDGNPWGVFMNDGNTQNTQGGGGSNLGYDNPYMDTALTTPTAGENRPVNMAVRYLIRVNE